jgi:hypothetical protein
VPENIGTKVIFERPFSGQQIVTTELSDPTAANEETPLQHLRFLVMKPMNADIKDLEKSEVDSDLQSP